MSRVHPFLLVFFLSISTAFSQEISVMSYNIYHGENPYKPGISNLADVAEIIKNHSPDFVALQEVDSMTERTAGFNDGRRINLVHKLEVKTGMKGFFAKAIDYSNGGYGEGVLIADNQSIQSHHKLMLPIPKGGEDRAVLMVNAKSDNGTELIFAGTHLCHQYTENRVAQAKEIVRYFQQSDIPVVLCGDFNFEPGSEPYKIMTEYFYDAAVLYGDPQNTYSTKEPRIRIDFIFLSKNRSWEVKSFEVLDENASDHKPVVGKIMLED